MKASELAEIVSRVSAGAKLIVVSNREPYVHEREEEGIRVVRPASGMVTALEPIVRAVGGTWIAHGGGSADRLVVDAKNRIALPPDDPKFILKRVWISRPEEKGYYHGMANTALWPLCHIVYKRPYFSRRDWESYKAVNRRFRDAVLEEAGSGPAIVFIQDYHFALLSRLIKEARPDIRVIQFWHIPWPNREAFRIFPWEEELLDGLLGNDLLGFHIQYHCNNFLETVGRAIESLVDYEHFRVFRRGHPTYVRPFPISVDVEQIGKDVDSPEVTKRKSRFLKELEGYEPDVKIFVGADRIDYTKGIPERLQAFDLMLSRYPEMKGKCVLVQLAAPSRTAVAAYRKLNEELDELVLEINSRHQTEDWVPIRFLRAHHDYYAVLAACRMANVVIVTSLHDGMNLVAKEFVSARSDRDGILMLSQYTGAARELADALQVNPFDLDQMADAMYAAYRMPEEERRQRMERMRSVLETNDVYQWGYNIFKEVERNFSPEGQL
ncbi:MAG TPA: trehalose-6-phosphate synthase [Candidatus Deferrimicrobiaceae bacterium]|nr:trehalose-6-phosphate synthase [Candidatus Deferrimicrobiaceae bacterium]